MLPCPHCGEWVSPEREHLQGWQDSRNELEAREKAYFACPACGHSWTPEDRVQANLRDRLLHGDQTIDKQGNVSGELPPTRTLGFRWSAVNNLFATPGDIGVDEWNAARALDEDNAEREMRLEITESAS